MDVRTDTRLKLIEAEFGLTGFAVIVKLYQYIYGRFGYYGEWNEEVALLFGLENRLGGSAVSEIIAAAIRRDIFDRDMYDRFSILTSAEIQENFFRAVARRAIVQVEEAYLLVDHTLLSDNVRINGVSVYKNLDKCTHKYTKESKVKESKVKESREKEPAAQPPTPAPFIPPTAKEVTAYAVELGSRVSAQGFVDYYEATGWMMGRTPMKDWKAAFRRWADREKSDQADKKPVRLPGQAYAQRTYDQADIDRLGFDWTTLK